jgi:hypothetical protein
MFLTVFHYERRVQIPGGCSKIRRGSALTVPSPTLHRNGEGECLVARQVFAQTIENSLSKDN